MVVAETLMVGSTGHAAFPAPSAQLGLYRHHPGKAAGGARLPAEVAGDCGEEQPDGAALFGAN